jgi:hypothetical protein
MTNQSEPILDLEALVPTRETCVDLRNAGFDYLTRFYWIQHRVFFEKKARQPLYQEARLAAPTVAELGALLPLEVRYEGVTYFLEVDVSVAAYVSGDSKKVFANHGGKNEAEARALLWLRLELEGLLPDDNLHSQLST